MTTPSRLSLETRDVGRVTVVQCNGRIVAGESETLRSHVSWLLRDRRAIVLDLANVGFIDSSGLGAMVRSLTSTRQARGDLKLCNVPEHVQKVLELSHLTKLFDTRSSEEDAVSAFYQSKSRDEAPVSTGSNVLCVGCNSDVLAYLRELLRRAGYDVQATSQLHDAMILMRITTFDLVLAGPDVNAPPDTYQAFQNACAKIPMIQLGCDFSTTDAGEAGTALLAKIAALLPIHSA